MSGEARGPSADAQIAAEHYGAVVAFPCDDLRHALTPKSSMSKFVMPGRMPAVDTGCKLCGVLMGRRGTI